MKATHKFSQFTYWNLETPPSNNDAVVKAMQWINIASAVSVTVVGLCTQTEKNMFSAFCLSWESSLAHSTLLPVNSLLTRDFLSINSFIGVMLIMSMPLQKT